MHYKTERSWQYHKYKDKTIMPKSALYAMSEKERLLVNKLIFVYDYYTSNGQGEFLKDIIDEKGNIIKHEYSSKGGN